MRGRGAIAACVGLALLVGGCGGLDRNYLREGVGTEVTSADIVGTSTLQEIYFGEICRQAGLGVRQTPEGILICDESIMLPGAWTVFVQAGMNDIDRRCDAYLAWLDNRRRWNEPILKQLHSTAAATAAIMGLSGVGAVPIAIVGTAFGFAQETFVNLSGRLITEINQSTVQSLVLTRQNGYRAGLRNRAIPNRPAALYALRSYLRICMPMTIETEINVTMTGVDRNGDPPAPMIMPAIATAPLPQTSSTRVNVAGSGQVATIIIDERYRPYLESFNPRLHSKSYVEGVLRALCVPPTEFASAGKVQALIGVYEAGLHQGTSRARANGLLDADEMTALNTMGPCPSGFRNAYERRTLRSAAQLKGLIDSLNRVTEGGLVAQGTPLSGLRAKIVAARRALRLEDPVIPDEVTPDFLDKLEEQ